MEVKPLDDALAEINAIKPPTVETEGLRDVQRLNLGSEMQSSAQALMATYEQRDADLIQLRSELTMARATMIRLLDSGYPALPTLDLSDAAFDDLEENRTTLERAFGLFRRRGGGATDIASTVGPQQPIPNVETGEMPP